MMWSGFSRVDVRRHLYVHWRSLFLMGLLLFPGAACRKGAKGPAVDTVVEGLSADHRIVTLSAERSTLFETVEVKKEKRAIRMQANARTLARAIPGSGRPLVIFEDDETARIYSDFNKGRAAFNRGAKQLQRMKALFANEAASGRDVLDAETEYRQAEASYREAETRLRQEGLMPARLDALSIDVCLVVADIPESRIEGIHVGARTELQFSSYSSRHFQGRVVSIADAVDPTTRTIRVGVEVRDPGRLIKPGMFARVLLDQGVQDAFVIPEAAVVTVEGKAYVFVKTSDTTFEKREVTTGDSPGDEFLLLSGLTAGDRVVTNHAILLKGMFFKY